MKYIVLFVCIIILTQAKSFALGGEEILRTSFLKSKKIESGNYEMIYRWKALTSSDTTNRTYNVDFEKLNDDTLYSTKFRLTQRQIYNGEKETYSTWYTGSEEISLSPKDSTATISNKQLYADDIKSVRHNRVFYQPFTNPDNFFSKNVFNDSLATIIVAGYELIGKNKCIKVIKRDRNSLEKSYFNSVYQFWIDTLSGLILRYDWDIDVVMNDDTMHQYHSYELKQYSLNPTFDNKYFSLEAIPKFYRLKDYTPYKQPALLAAGETAPQWELASLDGKKYSIKDFEGKILLFDFFYKSCYPCMKALPVLQSLYEKYKDRGLMVIGINPYDKPKEDGMKSFLDKRGITYLTLYDAKETAKEYKVSGYPTLYIVGKNGKILATEVGYGEDTKTRLEKMIEEYLQ
jgi:peroxiredoxin